jgi:DNA-binding HxlR family transcriptional regulator
LGDYEPFCSVARATELLGRPWTLLLVREALMGSSRFSEFQKGLPRISKTMLSARLSELVDAAVMVKTRSRSGPAYTLTDAGVALYDVVKSLGVWGQEWLPRNEPSHDTAVDEVIFDMSRRTEKDALPQEPVVLRITRKDKSPGEGTRFMLLRQGEVSLCTHNVGFPELELVATPVSLVRWWRGDTSFARSGLKLSGPVEHKKNFLSWFGRYLFADVRSRREAG